MMINNMKKFVVHIFFIFQQCAAMATPQTSYNGYSSSYMPNSQYFQNGYNTGLNPYYSSDLRNIYNTVIRPNIFLRRNLPYAYRTGQYNTYGSYPAYSNYNDNDNINNNYFYSGGDYADSRGNYADAINDYRNEGNNYGDQIQSQNYNDEVDNSEGGQGQIDYSNNDEQESSDGDVEESDDPDNVEEEEDDEE